MIIFSSLNSIRSSQVILSASAITSTGYVIIFICLPLTSTFSELENQPYSLIHLHISPPRVSYHSLLRYFTQICCQFVAFQWKSKCNNEGGRNSLNMCMKYFSSAKRRFMGMYMERIIIPLLLSLHQHKTFNLE